MNLSVERITATRKKAYFRTIVCAILAAAFLVVIQSPVPTARAQLRDRKAISQKADQFFRAGKYKTAIYYKKQYVELTRARFGQDHVNYGVALHNLALLYKKIGQYRQAEKFFRQALKVKEKAKGRSHPKVATTLFNLADLYQDRGRHKMAEPLYRRVLTIREKALGTRDIKVGNVLHNLANIYHVQGRYKEAERSNKRALSIYKRAFGPDHLEVAGSLNNLAMVYKDQGRYGEAEKLYKSSLKIREKAARNHSAVGDSLNNLAVLYESLGKYAAAERHYERALAIRQNALGPQHPDVAQTLNNLAILYNQQGRYRDAEPLFKRSLRIREKSLGSGRLEVAQSLNNLAILYRDQGRQQEAEPLYLRSLKIKETVLGPAHPELAQTLNNLAVLYDSQGRHKDAEPLFKRSLRIREKALGPDHLDVAASQNNLAILYKTLGRYSEAEKLHKRSLAIKEKTLGSGHAEVGLSQHNLAGLYLSQGQYKKALSHSNRSLEIREKSLGPDHPDVAQSLNSLADLFFAQRDWKNAANYWRRSTDLTVRREARNRQIIGEALTGKAKSEAERLRPVFLGLIKAVYRQELNGHSPDPRSGRETFSTAQWALASDAAASLAQMSARQAKGDTELAKLVRERQDSVGEWQALDKRLIAAESQPPQKRNAAVEKALSSRLDAIDKRISEIDQRLAKDFIDYAALANPKPLSITEVQGQLRENEALVHFLDTPEWESAPEETFVWIVTKRASHWLRSDLGTLALTERVQALRCGLDAEEWEGIEKPDRCARLLGIQTKPSEEDPLPFSFKIAHELYQGLFKPAEDLIEGKDLLIVPSGPLTSLPFQVLVTEKPKVDSGDSYQDYREVAWLGRRQAITVLPSVASLSALRRFAKTSPAKKAYVGYGDPDLRGDGSCRSSAVDDACPSIEVAAKTEQGMALTTGPVGQRKVRGRGVRRSAGLNRVFRKGRGDAKALLAEVRLLCPLPDTAYELKCVARSLDAAKNEIRLKASATEASIKALSKSGALATYRVVHFATHGLLAGDVEKMARRQGEPAIVLTPPKQPKDQDDDGLLTASEVTRLKLNADWVVLSACNTAAGERLGAEALSGLARAFFYAGARALLVSHWPVYSDAAVRLITTSFAEMRRNPKIGRAEALKRAMTALITDPSEEDNAHPSVWAPFVVVGEGAR